MGDNFGRLCNISVCGAIQLVTMVGAMAKVISRTDTDELVQKACTDADALGRLYDLYYERIFGFCVHRLFCRQAAEDVTSTVFLAVARSIKNFNGRSEVDFRNWLYTIAINQTNAHIRKAFRRKKLLTEAALESAFRNDVLEDYSEPDWPMLYQAILKLKPYHQTIVTLRFFEGLDFETIGRIVNAQPATVRVTLHRILKKLRNYLQAAEGD